jgi:SSS family solute:Na+ symporter
MIPGILIPVLGIYIRLFTLKKKWVIPTITTCIGISLLWLILGTIYNTEAYTYTFLGMEPFYPGLFASILFWLFGRKKSGEGGGDLFEETKFSKGLMEEKPD